MQVSDNDAIEKLRDENEKDTTCGIGSFKPKWIQPLANSKVYLILISAIAVLQGCYYTYRIGIMSTLEKRFSFDSKISGTILMMEEITSLVFGLPVGYYGGRKHKPRMIAAGMLCSVISCFISALPYIIYGPAYHLALNSKDEPEMCSTESSRSFCESGQGPPKVFAILIFMIAGFLKSFGNLAFNSIGVSYMDDNIKKKNTSMYLAVTQALRILGPFLGFVMASVFLKYNENPMVDPGYGAEDPRWIGAWWIGFLLQGCMLFIFTAPIALFPRRLPGTKHVEGNKEISLRFDRLGIVAAVKRLGTNFLFIFLVINITLSLYSSMGHSMMLPKYLEHQFRLTSSAASLYSGPPALACVILSFLAGGFLIWKWQPKAKILIIGMATAEFVGSIGFLLLMIPHCQKVKMDFSEGEDGRIGMSRECNENCNCSTRTFTPVCNIADQTTYFSPCFAGCSDESFSEYSKIKGYTNCSCASGFSNTSNLVAGFCKEESCWYQTLIYVISLPILHFIMNIFKTAYVIILLRSIEPEDKSIALGAMEMLTCLFGLIPLILTFGSLVDTSCVVWEESCGQTGNCWFYDTEKYNFFLHGVSGLFQTLSALSLIALMFQHQKLHCLYEDENVVSN